MSPSTTEQPRCSWLYHNHRHFAVLATSRWAECVLALSQAIGTIHSISLGLILRSRKQVPIWFGLILIQRQVWLCYTGNVVFGLLFWFSLRMHSMRKCIKIAVLSMKILCECSSLFYRVCSSVSSVRLPFYYSLKGLMQKKCFSLMSMNVIEINGSLHTGVQ